MPRAKGCVSRGLPVAKESLKRGRFAISTEILFKEISLEKAPVLDPFSDDLARAKSANELKESAFQGVL